MNTRAISGERIRETRLPRSIGLHGTVAVLGAMAGGVGLGGVLVGAMTLAGNLSGHALFMNATALFVLGATLGALHGTVLGYFGRQPGVTPSQALRDFPRAGLYAMLGLAVSWLVSVWIAMTVVAAYTGHLVAIIGVTLAWIAAAAILAGAAVEGWRALRNAYRRWPERGVGTILVAASFAALLMNFLASRPEIWGAGLRVTETGAVLLAGFLSIWLVGPIVTVALGMLRAVPTRRPMAGLVRRGWRSGDVLVGLVAGVVIGLLMVPFSATGAGTATAGSVVVAVSQALVDEVLLRLFLVTGVAWLLLRWHQVPADEAAAVSIVVSTVTQMAIYTPGALAVGFPTWSGTAAFILTAALIPAAVFGVLFWRRGFTAAFTADVVALLTALLLAA